ncbi:MAG: glycosyltransferase [Pseudomonadota bacterium]
MSGSAERALKERAGVGFTITARMDAESKMTSKRLSIIIPVYSNAADLPALFSALDAFRTAKAADALALDIIFVDDGSQDDSAALIRAYVKDNPDCRLIRLTRNFGTIAACKAALPHAKGDAVTYLAADLQDPLDQVGKMVTAWGEGASLVISQRADREDSALEKFFANIYLILVRRLSLKNYPQGGFDLFLADKSLFSALMAMPKNVNTQTFLVWLGIEPVVLDYVRQARQQGKSGWTFSKKYNLMVNNLFTLAPGVMRVSCTAGIAISCLIAIAAGVNALAGAGGASLIAVIAFLFALVFAALLILGEYLWRVLDLVNGTPETIIRDIIDHESA